MRDSKNPGRDNSRKERDPKNQEGANRRQR